MEVKLNQPILNRVRPKNSFACVWYKVWHLARGQGSLVFPSHLWMHVDAKRIKMKNERLSLLLTLQR